MRFLKLYFERTCRLCEYPDYRGDYRNIRMMFSTLVVQSTTVARPTQSCFKKDFFF